MPPVTILAGVAFLVLTPATALGGVTDHSRMNAAVADHPADTACHRRLTTENSREIRISGTLVRRMAWGPPNFGEHPKTDTRFFVWVVKLDYPIAVVTGPDIGMPTEPVSVREIQIVRGSTIGDARASTLSGKHVIVQGIIHSQAFYSDTTRAVIRASAIAAGGRVPCDG